MKRRLLVPVLAGVVAAMVGCIRSNRESVQLSALCFPPTPDANGNCIFSAGKCDSVLADGHLSVDLVASGGTLEYPIQVDNERVDNSDPATGRTNTNNAFIERFEMQYEAPGFPVVSTSVNQAATVPVAGSTVVVVTLIPVTAGAVIAGNLPAGPTEGIIKVKAHGRYGDDTEFDTADYSVPVAVSVGVFGPTTCPAPKILVGICPQNGQTSVALCQ
jgi:hypothetical protein